jgi:hypothetical protein
MEQTVLEDPAYVMGRSAALTRRLRSPMKTTRLVTMLGAVVLLAYAGRASESAGTTPSGLSAGAPAAVIDLPDEVAVGDRYLVPNLPASVVDQLPAAEAAGDRYLAERIALAELVVGDQILAAEDLATTDARELPGFAAVLLADGFRQDPNGAWYYDRFSSWMRFPLNR